VNDGAIVVPGLAGEKPLSLQNLLLDHRT
jgi:hypothetical protein